MPENFVHLHVHSEYSLLDGACQIKRLVKKVKELGQPAVALTDHGVMYGVVDFYKECKKEGIRPLIGCEVYVAPRTRFDKVHKVDSVYNHLILLCKNNKGYQNLIKMVSAGFIDGFYTKPRIDHDLLQEYSEGLVCLSACLAGELPQALLAGDYEKAKETALFYKGIFGEDYYIELQDHGIREQKEVLPGLVRLAKELSIPMVATNDAHYIDKADSKVQHVLLCIQTNKGIDEEGGLEFSTEEFYIKSREEMAEVFSAYPEALENTVKVAEKCEVEFEFGVTKLPYFKVPGDQTNAEYFRQKCIDGLYARYGDDPPPAYRERLEFELNVITTMGYVDYYLIVHDFIQFAKDNGIPVGPGRGSGAGSIAAYCIGITGIDPMRYNLLFERFLNPERVSMPDFDIDFCYERRQEVIDYVVRKYGEDHVAQIVTFGTMAARGAIRDVGRVMGVPYQDVDKVAKMVPFTLHITIKEALEHSKDLRTAYEQTPQIKELIDTAMQIEGMPRHASTHAAGVVITRDAVDTYVPLSKNDESIVTQFTMTTLEELGLLKMDFLGLRNLTVIADCEKMVREKEPDFAIEKVTLDDPGVFEILSQGTTEGVFQLESTGMKQVLTQLRPENLEDIIAVISLYRPGPMDSIPKYIYNRHHPGHVSYKHPLLEPILKVTYGCIVYQEQVMQICRELGGYSYGRADLVRRAMSKKKHDVMEKERAVFIEGCQKNGVSQSVAESIFDEMSSFASYAFNKSHAAAYAFVAYRTAYLKVHYPREYMASLLTSVIDSTDKVIEYIGECERLGIKVLSPSVNESGLSFSVSGADIRFGLLAVKNLGRSLLRSLVEEREANGPYQSFYDFCSRMSQYDMNKRAMESLIKCGALDGLDQNRKTMLLNFERVLSFIDGEKKHNLAGQINLFAQAEDDFEQVEIQKSEEYPASQLLAMEKETTGIYLSGHPMFAYQYIYDKPEIFHVRQLSSSEELEAARLRDNAVVKIAGIIGSKKVKITKSNSTMAFITIEDITGTIEALVFPKTLAECGQRMVEGAIVVLTGRISVKEDEPVKLICETVTEIEQYVTAKETLTHQKKDGAKKGLYLKVPSKGAPIFAKIKNILEIFDGSTPVYVYFEDMGKLTAAPKSLWVTPSDILIHQLKKLLGEENAVLR